MNLKNKLTLILILVFNISLFAQNVVKGTVVGSADKIPIPGVNVIIKGTKKGVSTNFDGAFQLEVKKGDVLIWHANVLHGGEKMTNPDSSRKSMVFHYYTDDAVCFHEITQRPTLK